TCPPWSSPQLFPDSLSKAAVLRDVCCSLSLLSTQLLISSHTTKLTVLQPYTTYFLLFLWLLYTTDLSLSLSLLPLPQTLLSLWYLLQRNSINSLVFVVGGFRISCLFPPDSGNPLTGIWGKSRNLLSVFCCCCNTGYSYYRQLHSKVTGVDTAHRQREKHSVMDEDEEYSSLRAKQLEKKEAELKALDAFFKEQLAQLEKRNLDRYKQTEKQFHDQATKSEALVKARNTEPVCINLQSQILNCYKENREQTLQCSDLAKTYMQCIDAAKKNLLVNHG
uniref:CHCH domain-containing protein n=1 Tax=Oncorhynchus mykiss TaxID=8022 RepID=A0A8K9VFX8_ONCMY